MKSLETVLNQDLRIMSDWRKANRLCLNVDKSKLLIFKSRKNFIDNNDISIKLNGCKLVPTDSHCSCKIPGAIPRQKPFMEFPCELSKKLSRYNAILCKLRHFVPKKNLISVYYSIFYSHLLYGCSVWTLTTLNNLKSIMILQKRCVRIELLPI